MKRGSLWVCLFWSIILWLSIGTATVQAEIASDDAFEGAVWELILEDVIEMGVVQSMCATEDYIILMENYGDGTGQPDIVKAYYRNDKDPEGNPVEKYSLAKRVAVQDYEHANGMAYNPNTGEIAVALYTSENPENRGCIFLMDADTLEYKGKVQIATDYNILGIGYDLEKDRYVIQTNVDGGYSFKILDNQFQVIEDLGTYAHTAKGSNFQDLCVSGDYIINFPLTWGMGIGDFIHVYSISRREMVSDPQLDFRFQDVASDEPESICELEPGVFLAAVNVVCTDGSYAIRVYKTMVPYNFPVVPTEEQKKTENDTKDIIDQKADSKTEIQQGKQVKEKPVKKILQNILKVVLAILGILVTALLLYMRYVAVLRERRRKLARARRERERIRRFNEGMEE